MNIADEQLVTTWLAVVRAGRPNMSARPRGSQPWAKGRERVA
jgi:hypothetical protein